jgi:hypothetical protein
MKHRCAECGRQRDLYRYAVRHVDGRFDVVCRQCWKGLEYCVDKHPERAFSDDPVGYEPTIMWLR